MAQAVQIIQFTVDDFKTQAGVDKLNLFINSLVQQIWALQGTSGTIRPDANIDMQSQFKVINQAP